MKRSILIVNNLTKTYHTDGEDIKALDNINLMVNKGQFASIIGKSGSGKSTLLSILGALDIPTDGEVLVDGVDITKLNPSQQTDYRAKKIGFVFQYYNLVPNLTALENVMLALEFGGVNPNSRLSRAQDLLSAVELNKHEQKRRPSKLSGGQQQRVAIARALANKPAIILADEPTGNLDSETGKKIFDLLHKLTRTQNTTIIAVTHDMDIAGKTDKTFRLRDGKIDILKV